MRTELILVAVAGLVAVALLTGWWYRGELADAERTAETRATFQSGLAAGAVDDSVGLMLQTVGGLAAQPGMAAVVDAPAACELALNAVGVFPAARLDIVAPDGSVVCSSSGAAVGEVSYLAVSWFGSRGPDAALSGRFRDPLDDGEALATSASIVDGGLVGFVVLVVALEDLATGVGAVYAGPDELAFTVVDGNDVISAAGLVVPTRAVHDGAFSAASGSWLDGNGVERIYGSAPVSSTGWSLFAGQDRSDVFAQARERLMEQLTIVALIAVVFGLVIFAVSWRIARPLRRVAAAMTRAAHEPVPATVRASGSAEIVRLGASIDEMLAARRDYEARLGHEALHDRLTGLPNRELCVDRLQHALERFAQAEGYVGVILCDLVDFRAINDRLGYDAGDRVLSICGDRLVGAVPPGSTVARLGSDDFAVICEGVRDRGDLDSVVADLERALELPVAVGGDDLVLRAWFGAAFSEPPIGDAPDLLRGAEAALREARGSFGTAYALFDAELRRRTYERSALDRDLRDAVSNGGLDVAFQPIIELDTGRVRGVEALARWNHPSRGAVSPLEFVSVAEESDLIAHIGRIVLERSCEHALLWGQLGRPIEIAVNVSARQLERGDLAPTVEEILTMFAVDADRLCLEITESMLVRANAVALTAIADLRAIGARIAIDDFGVGYSSLAYLRDLPVDELKIDRSFVADTRRPGPGRELVAAIVAMARALDLHVVAEGVEYEDQAATLRELRCHAAQGYLFSPALHTDEITELLVSSGAQPA